MEGIHQTPESSSLEDIIREHIMHAVTYGRIGVLFFEEDFDSYSLVPKLKMYRVRLFAASAGDCVISFFTYKRNGEIDPGHLTNAIYLSMDHICRYIPDRSCQV